MALALGMKLFFLFRESISDLLLEDSKNPLLLVMSNPEESYWQALASFKVRITYASCHPGEWKVKDCFHQYLK